MLILTGLLTLLVFTIAEGDGIKGGIKTIKTIQEKVTQDEIVPSPYSFNIKTGAAYGTKVTQKEAGDAQGRVKGSYSIASPRGISRVVEYHADDSGFHASVKTSEPNIETHSPANAHIEALSKKGASEAIQYAVQDPTDQGGKAHSLPALHHTAVLPQSQKKIQEKILLDSEPSGVKTSDSLKLTPIKVQSGGIKTIAAPSAETRQSSIKSAEAAGSGVKQSSVKTVNVPKPAVKSAQYISDSQVKGRLSSQHLQYLPPSSISTSTQKKTGDSSSGAVLFSLSDGRKVNPGQQTESLSIQTKPFRNPSDVPTANAQSELIGRNKNIVLDEDSIKRLGLTADDAGHYIVLPPGLANIAGSELESKIRIAGNRLNQGLQLHTSSDKLIEKNAGRSGSISRTSAEVKPIQRSQTAVSRQRATDQIRKLSTIQRQSSPQATGRLTSGTTSRNIGQISRPISSNQIGAQVLNIRPTYGMGIAQGTGQSIQTRRRSNSLQKEEKAPYLSVEPNLNFHSSITDRGNIRLLTSGGKYDSPVRPALTKDKLSSPGDSSGSIRPKAPFDKVSNQESSSAVSSGRLQTTRTLSATLRGPNLQNEIPAGLRTSIASNLRGIRPGSDDSKSGSIYFALGDNFQQQKPAPAGITTPSINQPAAKQQIISGIQKPEILFSAGIPEAIQRQISPAVSQRLTGIYTSQFQTRQKVSGSPASSSPLTYQQDIRSSSALGRRTSIGAISRSPGQTLSFIGGPQILSTEAGSAGSRSQNQFGIRQNFSGARRSQISSSQRSPGITPQRITTYQQETRSSAGYGNRALISPAGISSGISFQSVSGFGGSQRLFTPAVSGANLFEGTPGVSQTTRGTHDSELLLSQRISGAPLRQVLGQNQQAARRSSSLAQTRSDVTIGKRLSVTDKAILGDSGPQIGFSTGTLRPGQPQPQFADDLRITKIRSSQFPTTSNLAGIPASRLTVAPGSRQTQGVSGLIQKAAVSSVSQLSPKKQTPAAPKKLSIPAQVLRSSTTSDITQPAGKEQTLSGLQRPEILFAAGIPEAVQRQISPAVSQTLTGIRSSQFQTSQRVSGSPTSSSPLTYQQAVRRSSVLGRTSPSTISRSSGQTLSVIGGQQIVSTGGVSAGSRSEKQFGVRQSYSGARRAPISSSQRSPSISSQRITAYQQETRSSIGLDSRGLNSLEGISTPSISGVGGSRLLFSPEVSGASIYQGTRGVSQTATGIHGSELLSGQITSGTPIRQVLVPNQQAVRHSSSLGQAGSDVTIGKRPGVTDKAILGDSGPQIVFSTGTLRPGQPQPQSADYRRITKSRSSQIPATQNLAGIPASRLTVASGSSQTQGALGLIQKAAVTRVSQLSPKKQTRPVPASKPLSTQAFRSSASLGLSSSDISQPAGKVQTLSGIQRPEILLAAGGPKAVQPQISPSVSQRLTGIRTSQFQTRQSFSGSPASSSPLTYQQAVRSPSTLGGRTYGIAPGTLSRSAGQILSVIGGPQTLSLPGASAGSRSENEFGVRQSFSGARPSQISSSQKLSGISAPKFRISQQRTTASDRKAFSSSAGASAGTSGIGASEILLRSGISDTSRGISGISAKVTNIPTLQLSRSQITPGANIFYSSNIAQQAARRLTPHRIASDIAAGSLSEGKESIGPVIDSPQILSGGVRLEGTQPQTAAQLTQRGTGIRYSQFSRSQGISGTGASISSSSSQQAVRSSTSSNRRTYGTAEGISSGIFSQPGSGIGGPKITFIAGVSEGGEDKNLLGGSRGSSGSATSQPLRSQRLPGTTTSQQLTSNQQAARSAESFNRRVSGPIPVAVSGIRGQTISGIGASQYSVPFRGQPGEIQTQPRRIQQSIRSQISGERRPGVSVLPSTYQQPARISAVRISGSPQTDQSITRISGSQSLFTSGKPESAQPQRTGTGSAPSLTNSQLLSIQRTSGIPMSRTDPAYQRVTSSSEALKRRIPNLILDSSSGGIEGLIADVRGSQLSSLTASGISPSSGTLGISQRNSAALSSQIAKDVRVSAAPKPSLLSISGASNLRRTSQRTGLPTTSLRNIGIQRTSATGGVATAPRLTNAELLRIPSTTESRSPQTSQLNTELAQAERHNLNKIIPEVSFYGSLTQSGPGSSRTVSQASGYRQAETGKLTSQSKIESPVIQEKVHAKDIIQKQVVQSKEPNIKFDQVEQSKLSANPRQTFVDVPASQEKLSDGSQIKIDEVIEHSNPSQPQVIKLTQIKETITGKKHPAEAPSRSAVSKTTVTKVVSENAPKPAGIAFGSQDIQSVQQKLTDLSQSPYVPQASILSPFNYAVPILPSAKTGVKAPIVQEQQKLEQILV